MRTLLVVLPVLLAGTAVHAQAPAVSGPADLMPVPAEVVWQKGQLPLDAKMTVATAGPADPRVQAALERALVRLRALGVATARAASGAGSTPAKRAGGLGGAPLAPPRSMKARGVYPSGAYSPLETLRTPG